MVLKLSIRAQQIASSHNALYISEKCHIISALNDVEAQPGLSNLQVFAVIAFSPQTFFHTGLR